MPGPAKPKSNRWGELIETLDRDGVFHLGGEIPQTSAELITALAVEGIMSEDEAQIIGDMPNDDEQFAVVKEALQGEGIIDPADEPDQLDEE